MFDVEPDVQARLLKLVGKLSRRGGVFAGVAEEEQALAARCRETPGARYLLFEQNKATGQATCIFEITQSTAALQSSQLSAPQEQQQSNQMRKGDADNPLLDQLGMLVARWNQTCLEKENEKAPE